MPAQGNALGHLAVPIMFRTLKGCDKSLVDVLSHPFRVQDLSPSLVPRALPWAGVLQSFGLPNARVSGLLSSNRLIQ
jgi:hypothetical protein